MKTKKPTEIAKEVEKTHKKAKKADLEMPQAEVIVLEDTAERMLE